MYTLELTLRYSPFPITIQKNEYDHIMKDFNEIKNAMHLIENTSLINLECEKIKGKLVSVLAKEIIAIQVYEKSAVAGGSKRPGFSLDS